MIQIIKISNERPIASSLKAVMIIWVLYIIAAIMLRSITGGNALTALYIDGALRILFSFPCIYLLGKIIKGSGLKFTFTLKGLKKGLFAHTFFFLNLSLHIPLFFIASEMNVEFVPMIPAIIFFELSTGIFEETLFRGLFMTSMLLKFGGTAKGRIRCVLLSGLTFGLIHLIDGDFSAVLFAGVLGIGFAAAYAYSENLLCCMLFHALWNITLKIPNGLIIDINSARLITALQIVATITILAIPLFAIILTVKSKPFCEMAE